MYQYPATSEVLRKATLIAQTVVVEGKGRQVNLENVFWKTSGLAVSCNTAAIDATGASNVSGVTFAQVLSTCAGPISKKRANDKTPFILKVFL
ncbi:MAG: hypothetical protein LPK09_13245 [Hymenobacteraceae bacterium]|nr:hypothetical protein [Hymenobacteraceae bacterium]